MCALLNSAKKLNEKVEENLEEFYQLNFDVFMQEFVQLVVRFFIVCFSSFLNLKLHLIFLV